MFCRLRVDETPAPLLPPLLVVPLLLRLLTLISSPLAAAPSIGEFPEWVPDVEPRVDPFPEKPWFCLKNDPVPEGEGSAATLERE